MERRGRIPVAKFRTQEGKTRSRSRVREPDYNEQDPETDLFTLIEDNIALKEKNKELLNEIDEYKKIQEDFLVEKRQLSSELNDLKNQQKFFDTQMKDMTNKCTKLSNDRSALDALYRIKLDMINNLTNELQLAQDKQSNDGRKSTTIIVQNASLKTKLNKILPILNSSNELDSITDDSSAGAMMVTSELVEILVDEFLSLKNSMNAVELQLYEANEKIAELIENQHHLNEENETLRIENNNLTKVAKLLTENMKESVETSEKMENALIKLKQRYDKLVAQQKADSTDGHTKNAAAAATSSPTSPTSPSSPSVYNKEFQKLQQEVNSQTKDQGERIVEMKSLLDVAIKKNTNDELKTLHLKMEIMEEELRKALARAEQAEGELEKLKNSTSNTNIQSQTLPTLLPPPPPPPPPPPLPPTLLYKTKTTKIGADLFIVDNNDDTTSGNKSFNESIASHNLQKGQSSAQKIIGTVKQQVQSEAATGLDALMREFKSGRVTLRRNRRKTQTNDALQEMFAVLEISQKQNRNSKISIDWHL